MRKVVLSLLVENNFGVLSRVAGLFSRRGYNINSLTVGETENPVFSRMTIVTSGEEDVLEQIRKQLAKLSEVNEIRELPPGDSVARELILLKVTAAEEQRPQIISIAGVFRANIVDVSENTLMIELTGSKEKISAFINLIGISRIREMARTGITGLARGE